MVTKQVSVCCCSEKTKSNARLLAFELTGCCLYKSRTLVLGIAHVHYPCCSILIASNIIFELEPLPTLGTPSPISLPVRGGAGAEQPGVLILAPGVVPVVVGADPFNVRGVGHAADAARLGPLPPRPQPCPRARYRRRHGLGERCRCAKDARDRPRCSEGLIEHTRREE